jgi:hypothetical protein
LGGTDMHFTLVIVIITFVRLIRNFRPVRVFRSRRSVDTESSELLKEKNFYSSLVNRNIALPAPIKQTLNFRIIGRNLPGLKFTVRQGASTHREPVYVGIQRKTEVIDLVPGNAPRAEFNFSVDVSSGSGVDLDFRGPFVHGERGKRFLYLSWGEVGGDGNFTMFRRAKLPLTSIKREDILGALSSASTLECAINLTDEARGPICGTIINRAAEWRMV